MSSKLNIKIHTLLVKNDLDNFTLVDIRKAYSDTFNDELNSVETRKFIYRQLYRLFKEGLLTKDGEHNTRDIIYAKTPLFKERFQLNSNFAPVNNKNLDSIKSVDSRLIAYKVDLSSSIAESEEYQAFSKSNPNLSSAIYTQLQVSRENSARLLGQVRALENIRAIIAGANNET
ncbi:MAG: hypothetical protein P8I03_02485 [Thalassotalea sp.]|nr:hypothetical protein [Thalassotalea sp.]